MSLTIPKLTIKSLCKEAGPFSAIQSRTPEKVLYGVTDGKAVGTYLEQKFREYLKNRYEFIEGNSANGIDFPEHGSSWKNMRNSWIMEKQNLPR